MKKLLLTPLFLTFPLLLTSGVPAQTQTLELDTVLTLEEQPVASLTTESTRYQQSNVFLSDVYETRVFELLSINWEEEIPEQTAANIEIRFRDIDGTWSDWQHLHEDHDGPDHEHDLWSYVITSKSDALQYRAFLSTEDETLTPKISSLTFDSVSGGRQAPIASLSRLVFKDKDDSIVDRDEWGADESLRLAKNFSHIVIDEDHPVPEPDPKFKYDADVDEYRKVVETNTNGEDFWWPLRYANKVKKIVVHHTATTTNLDNPGAAVRAIYKYHAESRGWGDIGYNFIIAPDGTVYEGRSGGPGVEAAHAGGYNSGTVGIALLGNYSSNDIPGPMMQSLMDLIYEQADEHGIDVDGAGKYRGLHLNNVLMHRELSATACPGDTTADFLPEIKKLVGYSMDNRRNADSGGQYAYQESTNRDLILLKANDSEGEVIKLKNTGTSTWNSNTKLTAKTLSGEGIVDLAISDMKESSVAPGKTATFTLDLESGSKGGLAHFEIKPVFNGKNSLHLMDVAAYVEAPPQKTTTSTSSSSNTGTQAEVLKVYPDLDFEAGEDRYIWIQLKNTGSTAWTADKFELNDSSSDGVTVGTPRLSLRTASPGTSPRIFFKVQAPSESGEATLKLDPSFDGDDLLDSPLELDLNVEGQLSSVDVQDYDQAIRIKLTTDQSNGPLLSASNNFSIYNNSDFLKTFSSGTLVRVRPSGNQFLITSGSNRWTVDGPVRFIPEEEGTIRVTSMDQRPAWNPSLNDNTFRGTVEIRNVDNELTLINELALEDYLKGVAETSNDTHPEKAKAMSILARTYALFYITEDQKFPGKHYHLDDDPDVSQKYLGYGYEVRSSLIKDAVESTEGEVVHYNGKLVKTPYFSQSDGVSTKSAQEVWGWTNTPYLQSVPDTHCQSDSFWGHGVGLSGCGAEAFAKQGKSYEEIIKYYFTGVDLVKYTP